MTIFRPQSIHLLVLVLTLFGTGSVLASSQVDPVKTKKELQQIKSRISQLQDKIKSTLTQRDAAEKQLEQTEEDISNIRRKMRDAQAAQDQARKKLAELRQTQQQLNQAKARQKAALAADVNAAFRAGREEYIKLLLNQEDPEKLSRQLKYYQYFRDARIQRIDAFNNTLNAIADNEIQINGRVAELDTLKTQLSQEQDRLTNAQQRRQTLLAGLNSALKDSNSRVNQLKSNQADLEKVLQAVQESLSDLPRNLGSHPFGSLKGKLRWPSPGRISHHFGSMRDNGVMRWNGVLIDSPNGSPIRSIQNGRVVFAGWMRGFGNLIIVDHGGGYLSLYGHAESLLKSPGDWIRAGDTIALTGDSGGLNPPGLYFEIRHNGKPVNPARWCR